MVIAKALLFLPEESHEEAIRLISVTLRSGADPFTALAAVYRWTRGRPAYAGIHAGLERFLRG